MSFLKPAAGATFQPNGPASGLGHLFGADPSRISQIANGIGTAANRIAAAGGATAGYDGSAAPINNHLQMLDPTVLQAIMRQMGGGQLPSTQPTMGTYR